MNLNDAYRWLVRLDPYSFGIRKRGGEPLKDESFVTVHAFFKGNFKIQLHGYKDYKDNLEDKTVTKDYFCSDIQDDNLKILALAHLGTLYLRINANFSDELEATRILDKMIYKKRNESLQEMAKLGY